MDVRILATAGLLRSEGDGATKNTKASAKMPGKRILHSPN
jgi:hypothetical protein